MAQPPAYDRSYSFTDHSTAYPSTPQPGVSLDGEFEAIEVTTDAIRANIALIQADDGGLVTGIVGPDQLALSFTIGLRSVTSWAHGVAYDPLDGVWTTSGGLYRCLVAHTASASIATDIALGRWQLVVDFQAIANVVIQTAALGTITVDGVALSARFSGLDANITALGAADTTEFNARVLADATEVNNRTAADVAVAAAAAAATLAAKNLAFSLSLLV